MRRIYLDHPPPRPSRPKLCRRCCPSFATPPATRPRCTPKAAARAPPSTRPGSRGRGAGMRPSRDRVHGSGSEADNLALRGVVERWSGERGRHVVVASIEHDAVLDTARRLADLGLIELTVVDCDAACHVDPDALAAAVRTHGAGVAHAGEQRDRDHPGRRGRRDCGAPAQRDHAGAYGAVQGLGRVPVQPALLGVDLLTLSAHKVYGPRASAPSGFGTACSWACRSPAAARSATGAAAPRRPRHRWFRGGRGADRTAW